MEGVSEQSTFNIESTINQTPFENPAVQTFLSKWCEANDGIRPEYVDRRIWEERGGTDKVLEEKDEGGKILYIPQDLKLWEMVDVMEAVDTDTFSQKPERKTTKKEELQQLGKMFEHAGIYIAQRLDFIDQGKTIAENLATEFYNYGSTLEQGQKTDQLLTIDDIKGLSVPDEELDNVDRWLAGEDFYKEKRKKFDASHADDPNKEFLWEDERRKTIAQYFRVAEKSFKLQRKELKKPEGLQPWESDEPIHEAFLDNSQSNIRRTLESPKTELYGSIFRRGMELLYQNMPFDKLPQIVKDTILLWKDGETTLRKAINIEVMKTLLQQARASGDVAKITDTEKNLAALIQTAISNYTYEGNSFSPSKNVMTQEINCAAASNLGGTFLSELGINYLVGDIPGHSVLLMIHQTGEVEYTDMLLDPVENFALTNDMINGENKDGNPITVEDIVDYSFDNRKKELRFTIENNEKGRVYQFL